MSMFPLEGGLRTKHRIQLILSAALFVWLAQLPYCLALHEEVVLLDDSKEEDISISKDLPVLGSVTIRRWRDVYVKIPRIDLSISGSRDLVVGDPKRGSFRCEGREGTWKLTGAKVGGTTFYPKYRFVLTIDLDERQDFSVARREVFSYNDEKKHFELFIESVYSQIGSQRTAGSNLKKDEFESTAQFEERKRKAREAAGRQGDEFVATLHRSGVRTYQDIPVQLGVYDADNQRYTFYFKFLSTTGNKGPRIDVSSRIVNHVNLSTRVTHEYANGGYYDYYQCILKFTVSVGVPSAQELKRLGSGISLAIDYIPRYLDGILSIEVIEARLESKGLTLYKW